MLVDLDHDTSTVVASLWKYSPGGVEGHSSWDVVKRVLWGILALHFMMKGSKSYPPVRLLVQTIVTLWLMKLAAVTALVFGEEWMGDAPPEESEIGTERTSEWPWSLCCHKRRAARFWKCSKRRQRRRRRAAARAEAIAQRTQGHHDDGSPTDQEDTEYYVKPCRFAVAFCKTLNLPPPLPFVRRRHCVHHSHDESDEEPEAMIATDSRVAREADATDATDQDSLETKDGKDMIMETEVLPSQCSRELVTAAPVARRTSHLIDTVRMQQWQFLLNHADHECISRSQAKYRDADGLYPLHWAVAGGAPTELVQRLAETYPSAVRRPDHEGSTPLHFATHYGSKAVLYLVQLYPEAASQLDTHGRSPLFHAVSTQPLSVLMVLVQTAPTMITTPCYSPEERRRHLLEQGRSSRKRRSVKRGEHDSSDVSVSQSSPGPERAVSRDDSVRTPLFRMWNDWMQSGSQCHGKVWDKAVWLLLTAYHQGAIQTATVDSVDERDILHASIQMDVYLPEAIAPLLISVFPERLSLTNAHGQLPLLIAVLSGGSSHCPWVRTRARVLVQELLSAWRAAASHRHPFTGRSALMDAIGVGHVLTMESLRTSGETPPSVLQQLIQAAPDLLQARDYATGLPPALLAALPTLSVAWEPTTWAHASVVDPYHLLSSKQLELVESSTTLGDTALSETRDISRRNEVQLETIYALLRSDPAQLVASL